SLSLSTTLQGQRFYQASSSINSTSPVTGGYGTNVNFRSGVEIQLTPGFNAVQGTEFKGYIGPCNSGVPFTREAINENDSVISFQCKINEYRLYGQIEKVSCSNAVAIITVNLKQAGDYYIKIYNPAINKYVTASKISSSGPGVYVATIPAIEKTSVFLRADLFKNNDLIFMQDFENK
ncbi:MAG: 3-coathanger stack domain-containing protein, partial [Ferruginibacter sp.]